MKKSIIVAIGLAACASTQANAQGIVGPTWGFDPVFTGSVSVNANKYDAEEGTVSGPASLTGTFSANNEENIKVSETIKNPQPPGTTVLNLSSKLLTAKVANKDILTAMVTLGDIASIQGFSITWIADSGDPLDGAFYAVSKTESVEVPTELLSIEFETDGSQAGVLSQTTQEGDLLRFSSNGAGFIPATVTVGAAAYLTEAATGVLSCSFRTALDKEGVPFTTSSLRGTVDGPAEVSGVF